MVDTIIRKARIDDINAIVLIHKAAFKDFFLTSLGERFLRLYYTSFIVSGHGVVFCADKNGIIVGFSATSYVSKGFNSILIKKNLVKYCLEGLRLFLSQPKAIIRLAKNLNKGSKDNNIQDTGSYAELYSIAINPDYQGEGIGRFLLTVTEADIKKHNNTISLTTDYYDNDKTISFYKAMRYEKFYEFTTYPERKMLRMIKEL